VNSNGGRLLNQSEGDSAPSGAKAFQVKVVDFPAVLRSTPLNSLLLKMDVEGEERTLLPAIMSLLPDQTAIFFETHFGQEEWEEIRELLQSNGFNVEQINMRGPYCDGFAIRDRGQSS
jgi:hypothetical protein